MTYVDGWGRGEWGSGAWNENAPVELVSDNSLRIVIDTLEGYTVTGDGKVTLTGQELNTTLSSIFVSIDVNQNISGQELSLTFGNYDIHAGQILLVSGFELDVTEGNVDPAPDVPLSGIERPLFLGDVTFTITGRLNLIGQELNTELASANITITAGPAVTGIDLEATSVLGSVLATVNKSFSITGEQLNTQLLSRVNSTLHNSVAQTDVDELQITGNIDVYNQIVDNGVIYLDGDPHKEYIGYSSKEVYTFDVDVIQLNNLTRGLFNTPPETHPIGEPLYTLTSVIPTSGTANVDVTGIQLNATLGITDAQYDAVLIGENATALLNSVVAIPGQEVPVTGQNTIIDLGTLTFTGNANVPLTGQQLIGNIGSFEFQIWTRIETGTKVNWTIVDTAA